MLKIKIYAENVALLKLLTLVLENRGHQVEGFTDVQQQTLETMGYTTIKKPFKLFQIADWLTTCESHQTTDAPPELLPPPTTPLSLNNDSAVIVSSCLSLMIDFTALRVITKTRFPI